MRRSTAAGVGEFNDRYNYRPARRRPRADGLSPLPRPCSHPRGAPWRERLATRSGIGFPRPQVARKYRGGWPCCSWRPQRPAGSGRPAPEDDDLGGRSLYDDRWFDLMLLVSDRAKREMRIERRPERIRVAPQAESVARRGPPRKPHPPRRRRSARGWTTSHGKGFNRTPREAGCRDHLESVRYQVESSPVHRPVGVSKPADGRGRSMGLHRHRRVVGHGPPVGRRVGITGTSRDQLAATPRFLPFLFPGLSTR